ncbi:MAG: CDP-alcohol phosphatidyltransferase family protein [Candidatus Eisenbacteria bacterium]|nr:CDP-alcohol phosphatidyltransferase family protein [Candidatus Eisenbacteria bacterium]
MAAGEPGREGATAGSPRGRLADLKAAPNLLSLLRLGLVPVVLWLVAGEERAWAVAVLLAMALTDGLDGFVARRTGRVTELGKVLDPLADKVAVDSVLLFLAVRGEFPVWALSVVLGRDVAIGAAAVLVARRIGGAPSSNLIGKAAFVSLAALAIIFLADLQALEAASLAVALVLVAASSVSYWIGARSLLGGRT